MKGGDLLWIEEKELLDLICSLWSSIEVEGWAVFTLSMKLKLSKEKLMSEEEIFLERLKS